ncbi:MAG: S46 family peptidase, partial [Holophaga sp.]|nr:S46 family peptidase [Holophaga sp.]
MRLPILAALLAVLVSPATLRSEEGMWTFDNLPLKALKAQHAFEPDKAWLDHLRLASVRLSGGSASFVSADGLVLTNHHMVRGNVQRLSTRERDLLKDGFVAATREQELKVPGLEVFVLVAMENISERVLQAGQAVKTEAQALRARERETQKAREELRTKTGLTVEPVALYQGGETWLYVYRKFTDVRLVMAPELSVARFGGDHDNFTYPRHHLDFAMVRVYEGGKPYRPETFLQWSAGGLKTGELALVSGHPGTTNRLWTLAQMEYARDFGTPMQVAASGRRRAILEAFAQRSFEARSQVGGQIYGIDNGLKATKGYLAGLKDVEAMKAVARTETELKKKVAADPKLKVLASGSWAQVQKALIESRKLAPELMLVNARGSELLGIALHLVRLPVEVSKIETTRLSEYSSAALVPLKTRLTQARPIPFNPELE